MSTIKKFQADLASRGGASLSLDTGEYNPSEGYFVSTSEAEQVFDEKPTLRQVELFVNKHIDKLYGKFLGGWLGDDGKYYLDVSDKTLDLSKAITLGMLRDQKAIYDAANGEDIHLPKRQKAGTEYQKMSYIDQVIDKILDNPYTYKPK